MTRKKITLQEKIELQKKAVKEAEAKVKLLQAKQAENIGRIGVRLGLDQYGTKEIKEIMALGLELFKDDGTKSVEQSAPTSNNNTIESQESPAITA
jgi:hypothetical protein